MKVFLLHVLFSYLLLPVRDLHCRLKSENNPVKHEMVQRKILICQCNSLLILSLFDIDEINTENIYLLHKHKPFAFFRTYFPVIKNVFFEKQVQNNQQEALNRWRAGFLCRQPESYFTLDHILKLHKEQLGPTG